MVEAVGQILHHQADMFRIVQTETAAELGIAAVQNQVDVHAGEGFVAE